MNRFTIFKKLSIQTWQEVQEIANQKGTIFSAMCIGKASHASEFFFPEEFKIEENEGLFDYKIRSFRWAYKDTDWVTHQCLADCNLEPKRNTNQHLLFRDKQTAEDYTKACREDKEECERYRTHLEMCSAWSDEIDRDWDDFEDREFEFYHPHEETQP